MRYTLSAPSPSWTAPTRRTTRRAGRRLATSATLVAATLAILPAAHPFVLLALTAAATVALHALPLFALRSAARVLRAVE